MKNLLTRIGVLEMKKIILVLVCICLVISLTSCSANQDKSAVTPTEDAYMMVFMEFYSPEMLSAKINGDVYYISVSLDGVLHENPDLIKHQIENYLKDTDVILLWENMDALIDLGHIHTDDSGFPTYFENGSLFSFNDILLTDTLYEASPSIWFGNLGGEGATYEVKAVSGAWEITSITEMWIS